MPSPQDILFKYWGFSSFRPVQQEVVEAVVEGKDVLALMPTGGGKSICFQVPALVKEGICIVISPLIALMKDQVEALRGKGIKAAMIFSGMNSREIDITLDNCIYGDVKLLYISPERIKTDIFKERVSQMRVNLIAVDEAHCISQWGYDFRPAYLKIIELRELLPDVPCIALTATATPDVKQDIVDKLKLSTPAIFQKSFVRNNLSYSVFEEEDKERRLIEILRRVAGSAIVYVNRRKNAQQLAKILNQNRLSAAWYHAGLSVEERDKAQEAWIKGKVRIMVATNAFGMGIDKPDVRLVIHQDIPQNLEAYYQEAGRAGRDEAKAYAVMLYHQSDIDTLQQQFEQSHPDRATLMAVYQSLANYYKIAVGSGQFVSFDFIIEDFAQAYQLKPLDAFYAIRKLEELGFIQLNDSFYSPSRLYIKLDQKQLYAFQIAHEPYDMLIKAILRAYGGEILSDFMPIKEQRLAEMLQVSRNEVVKKMEGLQEMDVVIYDKQKDKPQLIFTTQRFDANALPIDKAKMEERYKTEQLKLKRVVAYLENRTLCRTRFLTEYFGEANYEDCKVCDVCLEKQRKNKIINFNKVLFEKVKMKLQNAPLALEDLLKNLSDADKKEMTEIVRLMLENQILRYDDNGKLFIVDTN